MKKSVIIFIFFLGLLINLSAQSVGINTTSPHASAALDVSSTTKGMLVPRMLESERMYITSPANGLLVYQTDGTAGFYFWNGAAWMPVSGGTPSELQKITEGSNTGWRILGRNPLNYGNIGSDAMDLSNSTSTSSTKGATGNNSTAMGVNTIASGNTSTAMGTSTIATGDYSTALGEGTWASGFNSTSMGSYTTASGVASTAMGGSTIASGTLSTSIGAETVAPSYGELAVGSYNTIYTPSGSGFNTNDRAFGVGIGSGSSARKDGLIVYKDGTLAFNKLTAAPAVTTDRFYILNNKVNYNGAEIGGASELQKITEGSNTGWRLLGADPANYGNIGSNAVDLSNSPATSTTRGATGSWSTALGINTAASGSSSTALGSHSTASGDFSTAMGVGTTALGSSSTAMGSGTNAVGNYATAMGESTIASGIHSTSMGSSTTASGAISTAMGEGTWASGFNSTSMGSYTTASGDYSTAMGGGTIASGTGSTSIGAETVAPSCGELAVGSYNTTYTPSSSSTINTNDRAFGVGIGANSSARKDGLIVYKSGNTFISNDGNTPSNGFGSIIPGFGVGALQVYASGDGFNMRTGTGNNSMNIAKASAPSNGNTYLSLGYVNGSSYTEVGSIKATGSSGVSFNTSSDKRLKIDNGTYSKGLSTLIQIKIHDYTWKEDSKKDVGVFAQELYAIYPGAVSKGDDKVENDPAKIEKRWQVDYSKLVPVLIAAIQELSDENQALKVNNASLTSRMKELDELKTQMASIQKMLSQNN